LITTTIAASLLAATLARAEDGATADTIVFGQAVVFDPQTQPDFVSLEGYLAGRLAIAAISISRRRPWTNG
jgi:hypothetical protein